MRDFKIYLSGGMSGLSWKEQNTWRKAVKEYFSKLEHLKYRVNIFSPPDYYNFENKRHDTELEVMKFDLRNVKNSDLVLVNFNNPLSIGTAQELAIAYDRDIPIVGTAEKDNIKFHPWLKEECDKIFTNAKEACEYIADFYLI